jgi:putative sigma-54 modulation protein
MQTSVTFKNIDSSDHLKAYVSDKLDRFDRFLDAPAEASVVLTVEKFRHIAEISVSAGRLNINGKEETGDMYSAIDLVLDKLDKQLKRNKEKIRDRWTGSKGKTRRINETITAIADDESPREIKVKNIEYKPMDVEEAAMQMDLITDNFLVFTNARTEQINVLYRRKDGHLGLIQPAG